MCVLLALLPFHVKPPQSLFFFFFFLRGGGGCKEVTHPSSLTDQVSIGVKGCLRELFSSLSLLTTPSTVNKAPLPSSPYINHMFNKVILS